MGDSYIAEAIRSGVRTGLLSTMVAMPGIIRDHDPETQTVKVDIAIKRIVNGEPKAYTLLIDVPILLPTVQGFHITLPVKPGDECLLIFADRCIDKWFEEGGVKEQLEHRVHHISDGFAFLGVNSLPNVIKDYAADDLVIRNTANTQKVTLKASGDIEVETSEGISMKADKALNIEAASVNIKTGSVAIDAGSTTTTGSITASGDVVGAGISLSTHVHGGVVSGGSTTAPPQ